MRRAFAGFGLCAWVMGCGASTPEARDARSEIVVDDGLRVEGRPDGGRTRVGDLVLPALPEPLDKSSADFQDGFRLALEVLSAPAPNAPVAADEATYRRWAEGAFRDWFAERTAALERAQGVLNRLARSPATEQVPAAALLALSFEHTVTQLSATAPPSEVQRDAVLTLSYRVGLDAVSAPWLGAAHLAFQYCAERAARQTEPAFGLWLELCQTHDAALEEQLRLATSRAVQLEAQREAERLAAAGPPPAGPEVCWQPAIGAAPAPTPPTPPTPRAARLAIVLAPVPASRVVFTPAQERTLHAALRDKLAPDLATLGVKLAWLADAELDAAIAAQSEQRLRVDGPRCQGPSPLPRVLAASAGPVHVLRARVVCAATTGTCHALFGFDPPLPEAQGLAWTAQLSGPADALDTWRRALAELAPMPGRLQRWDEPEGVDERDRRYGPRDEKSGVRMSVRVKDEDPTMDTSALSGAALGAALGRCVAQHEKPSTLHTTAVHATLQVSELGKVQSVSLEAEPSSEAKAPSAALDKCLKAALRAVQFACSPNGSLTSTSALICLRRDEPAPKSTAASSSPASAPASAPAAPPASLPASSPPAP